LRTFERRGRNEIGIFLLSQFVPAGSSREAGKQATIALVPKISLLDGVIAPRLYFKILQRSSAADEPTSLEKDLMIDQFFPFVVLVAL
jgi:hypothetical protein